MTFTDDDLKRLWIEINGAYRPEVGAERLTALLARLEASERVCAYAKTLDEDRISPMMIEAIKAWRKAKGEDDSKACGK